MPDNKKSSKSRHRSDQTATTAKPKPHSSKRKEADDLESTEHKLEMKRLRAWSTEEEETKRLRTRSYDAAEEKPSSPLSAEEWRHHHNITVRTHSGSVPSDAPFLQFRDTPFNDRILQSFQRAGYTEPTPIQAQAWPIALQNKDMICVAKTGSGKTCGFLLPVFHQHLQNGETRQGYTKPVLLVLAPTRELSVQILEEAQRFGRPLGIRSVCCYGGSAKFPQIAALERGVECIIATPGRLNDLLEARKADLASIKYLVLDEADRMVSDSAWRMET